ncbi:MAG: hypothetical protein JWM74_3839, partial [Myxococcaceae bacterium]|nr:hypothetical protein [Myxococcaceae bacterium]
PSLSSARTGCGQGLGRQHEQDPRIGPEPPPPPGLDVADACNDGADKVDRGPSQRPPDLDDATLRHDARPPNVLV